MWKETHFTGTLWTHRFAVWQIAWHGIEFKRGHQYLVCKKYYNFLLFKAAKEKLSLKVFDAEVAENFLNGIYYRRVSNLQLIYSYFGGATRV